MRRTSATGTGPPGHAPPSAPSKTARGSLLAQLHAIRNAYGPAVTDEKLRLIGRLERMPLRSARALVAYHDDLLFLRAFPDDARVLAATAQELERFGRRVRALAPSQRRRLDDSGMSGSVTRHAFAFGIAQWLTDGGEDADIEWDNLDAPERLDPLLRLSLTQAEADAFDSGEISTREWLALAAGRGRHGALRWIVHDPRRPPGAPRAGGAESPWRGRHPHGLPDPAVVRLLYESLEIPVRWRVSTARGTTGNLRTAAAPSFRHGMRGAPVDAVAHVAAPLASIARARRQEARAWIDAARAALAARCREVHAITYANADEVWIADLGEGAQLCLIGAAREDRLTLEANYGYVLFSNGVPVGYGGVTPLAAQANTGINVFDAFRHSEAAFLFAQALRAFRSLFGISRFVVNPYQFGAGNDEALASGAFWFYDRLGFRPVEPAVATLAERERARRRADRRHRTTPSTLRRLAAGDLVLELPDAAQSTLFEERWLVTIARAVTETLAASDAGQRLTRRDEILETVAQALGMQEWRAGDARTRYGARRLAPVIALVLDEVRGWTRRERRALLHLFAMKGSAQERDFAVAARRQDRLWSALRDYCIRRDRPARKTGARH